MSLCAVRQNVLLLLPVAPGAESLAIRPATTALLRTMGWALGDHPAVWHCLEEAKPPARAVSTSGAPPRAAGGEGCAIRGHALGGRTAARQREYLGCCRGSEAPRTRRERR